jgi:hypothetical protein
LVRNACLDGVVTQYACNAASVTRIAPINPDDLRASRSTNTYRNG